MDREERMHKLSNGSSDEIERLGASEEMKIKFMNFMSENGLSMQVMQGGQFLDGIKIKSDRDGIEFDIEWWVAGEHPKKFGKNIAEEQ